jgi:hypothetical protein
MSSAIGLVPSRCNSRLDFNCIHINMGFTV